MIEQPLIVRGVQQALPQRGNAIDVEAGPTWDPQWHPPMTTGFGPAATGARNF